ncbi:MAG: hypothetical protein K5871_09250 [Lachnospiraceae bacterium]|nr:hypothetical protein [Lachnospiraceae bacterium]
MSTLREEEKKRWEEIKEKPFSYKLEYFWDYYKFHVIGIIVAVIIVVSIVKTIASYRDYALCVIMVNTEAITADEAAIEWASDLEQLLDVDTDKYQVYIDTSIMIGNGINSNIEYAAMQKLTAYLTSATIDVFIADTASYEEYCQNRNLCDLRDIFTEEELEQMAGRIYYTDAATYADYDDITNIHVAEDQAGYTVDHHDPDSMEDPIPTGIFVSQDSRIGTSGIYDALKDFEEYQGHPSEAVMGITRNTTHLDASIEALRYFMN